MDASKLLRLNLPQGAAVRPTPGFTPCTKGQAAVLELLELAGSQGAPFDPSWPIRAKAVAAMVCPGWIFRDPTSGHWRLASLGREMLAIWRTGRRTYSWELGRWVPEAQ